MMMLPSQIEIEDQESVTEIYDSLSDNADSNVPTTHFSCADSTILLREDSPEYAAITNCFLSGMGYLATDTTVVEIRKVSTEKGITTKAKLMAFRVFAQAMASKNGGVANVKCGWYGRGSKEEIEGIVSYGFSNREIEKFESDERSHGVGIHLIHHNHSLSAAVVGEADEEGIYHILFCRLILGKPELIVAGSKQSYPSSVQFDSGVDNLENPRRYVIWSSTMNSYIFPSHIVSFKSPRLRGFCRGGVSLGRARSPCVSLSVLMSILSKSLDPPRMNVILTTYSDFRKRKIRREELVRKMRQVVGDNLLVEIINNQKS